MPHAEPCPPREALRQFLANELTAERETAIETHLEQCSRCLMTCETLVAAGSLHALPAGRDPHASEFPEDLKELREQICAHGPAFAGTGSVPEQLARPFVTVLEVIEGPRAGARFEFDRRCTFLVGRGFSADLQLLDDQHFSRSHFLLEVNPPICYLRDLRSRNGTFVNGQRVQEAFLRHGDTISGGETRIRFSLHQGGHG